MFFSVVALILSLAVILYSCELFTNGIEWLGKKLNISQGAVGSVLAAVGTALPETIIPIIAIVFASGAKTAEFHEVGVGAIAGAPFMLTTLAFFVTGFAVLFFSFTKKRSKHMNVDTEVISRDIGFFLMVYSIAVSVTFIPSHPLDMIRISVAVLLVASYVFYVYRTFSDEEEGSVGRLEELIFSEYFKVKVNLSIIIIQVLIALAGIVLGAHFFVDNMVTVSEALGVSTLILSLILTPIATELPEKFNSIIWVSKKKDTLAIGNITGAMVFQSCFPVAFGVLYTPWELKGVTLVSAGIAILSGLANYVYLKVKKTLNPYMLLTGGLFYLVFIGYIFWV